MQTIISLIVENKNEGTYIIHETSDVGLIPISTITNDILDSGQLADFRDVLSAEITNINEDGAYGIEITLKDISADRLLQFDEFLANFI